MMKAYFNPWTCSENSGRSEKLVLYAASVSVLMIGRWAGITDQC